MGKAGVLFERITEAQEETAREVREYADEHREFRSTADRMLAAWKEGRLR